MNRRLLLTFTALGLIAPSLPGCIAQELASAPGPTGSLIGNSGDPAFDAWLNDFYSRALAAGWPGEILVRELGGLTPNPQTISLDRRQPEISRPTGDYIKGAVSEDRIRNGASRRAALSLFPDIEARFGVPSEVLTAVWGMESAFGAVQGDFDIIRACATLAADGRRRPMYEAELYAALTMISSGQATRGQLKGSWAGAMGQTQFMPSSFLSLAVDEDGDGRKDIWGSQADALASAANLLAKAGWKAGQSWQREVILPEGFDYSVIEGPRQIPPVWAALGVTTADGYGWSAADGAAEAQLIAPSGAAGPIFLVFPNHFMIRRYNNSTAYALGVGLLAERIAGRAGVIRPWPVEVGLSNADRLAAQDSLNRLGFNAGQPDGVIGVNTRAAVRNWQKSRGLIADGYLTVELVRRLQAEAAAPPPVP